MEWDGAFQCALSPLATFSRFLSIFDVRKERLNQARSGGHNRRGKSQQEYAISPNVPRLGFAVAELCSSSSIFHARISTPCFLFPPFTVSYPSTVRDSGKVLTITYSGSLSLPPSIPSPMMLPVIPQRWSLGTGNVSAGPRLSTTQQPPNIRAPINSYRYRQHCPPAGSPDDLYGDAPPPYYSLRPPGNIAMRSINAEVLHGITRTDRRVKSESCASPYHGQDDDFLANLAAIQLLSGCRAVPGTQSSARRTCYGTGCDGIACVLEDLGLHMLSKELSKQPTRPITIQTTLHGGADGHMSLESTDRVRMCARCRSTPMTPPVSRERFPSEDLDRRLQSIADALHRDRFANETEKKRLHTSEMSRREQSLTADDTLDVDHPHHDHNNTLEVSVKKTSRGVLGALRSLQHKDRPKRRVSTFPSLDSSEIPSSSEAEVPASRRI